MGNAWIKVTNNTSKPIYVVGGYFDEILKHAVWFTDGPGGEDSWPISFGKDSFGKDITRFLNLRGPGFFHKLAAGKSTDDGSCKTPMQFLWFMIINAEGRVILTGTVRRRMTNKPQVFDVTDEMTNTVAISQSRTLQGSTFPGPDDAAKKKKVIKIEELRLESPKID